MSSEPVLCINASRVPPVEEGESLAAVTTSPTDSSPSSHKSSTNVGVERLIDHCVSDREWARRVLEATRLETPLADTAFTTTEDAKSKHPSTSGNTREQAAPVAKAQGELPRARSSIAVCRRPSDGRGPGMDPRPPCAFKVSMFNVFCNSH